MIHYVPKEQDSRPSMWYQDPSDAYEVGKNWCISVPFHELKLIEEAKKRNCKSVAQFVRKVIWNEIQLEKELQKS